jgi:hypothetical protein
LLGDDKEMKKKGHDNVESLDFNDFEEDGFIEGDFNVGKAIASFSFGASLTEQVNNRSTAPSVNINMPSAAPQALTNLGFRTSQRGLTPAVDGELYTVKRCYQFRPSTLKKLNELKANDSDYNVYLNTIIDQAILFYYDHVFAEKSN